MSDPEVLVGAMRLAAEGRHVVADLIALLLAVDARRLYAEEGYSSLFRFCVERLRLSEEEAYYRIAAGRVAARFPVVLDRLREGRLTLTAVAVLRKHLTEANHAQLLAAAEGRSKREVQALAAAVNPRPDLPTSLRKLPTPRANVPGAVPCAASAKTGRQPAVALLLAPPDSPRVAMPSLLAGGRELEGALLDPAREGLSSVAARTRPRDVVFANESTVACDAAPAREPVPRAFGGAPEVSGRATIIPLAPARYSLRVTIGEETCQKLRRAQDLLGHRVGPGDAAAVLDRALTLLVAQLERQRFAPETPRQASSKHGTRTRRDPSAPPSKMPAASCGTRGDKPAGRRRNREVESPPERNADAADRHRCRYIPAAVRREVWRRDNGRCRYVSPEGQVCGATARLEYHHKVPFADGGEATESNLELRCRVHQHTEARRWFGEEVTTYRGQRPVTGQDAAARPGLALVNACRRSGTESG